MLIPIDPNKSFEDLKQEVKNRFNITAKGFAVDSFHISLSDEIGDIMEHPRDEMVEVITSMEEGDGERRLERGIEEVEVQVQDHQPRSPRPPLGDKKRKFCNHRERNGAGLSLENNAELSIENERQVINNTSRPLSRWSQISLEGVNHVPSGQSPRSEPRPQVMTPSAEFLGKADVFSKEAYMSLYKRLERVEAQLADFKNAEEIDDEGYRSPSPFVIQQTKKRSYISLNVPNDVNQSIFFSDNVSLAVEPPESDRESNFETLLQELERSSESEIMHNLPQPVLEEEVQKVKESRKELTLEDESDSEGRVLMKNNNQDTEIEAQADCEVTSAEKPRSTDKVAVLVIKNREPEEAKEDDEDRRSSTTHTVVEKDQEERETDIDEQTPDPEPDKTKSTPEPESTKPNPVSSDNIKKEPSKPSNENNKEEPEIQMSDTDVKQEVSSLNSGAEEPQTPRGKLSRKSKIAARMAERLQKRIGPRLTLEPTSRKPKTTPPVSTKRPRSRFRRNSGAYFIDGNMSAKERNRIERMKLKEGDKLEIDGHREGTIKFIGETPFSTGIIYGLELIGGTLGENSGTVDGVRYFECREHRGVFIASSDIRKKVREPKPKEPRRSVYQRRLELIFEKHNPSKVKRVERLLNRYEGMEHALYTNVCKKYGVTPEKEYKDQ